MKRSGFILLFSLGAGLLVACQSAEGDVVAMPRELMGVWRTSSPPYEDRYLELTSTEVRFGTGGDTSTAHQIAEIREVRRPEQSTFNILYLSDEELEYLLSVNYSPESHELHLANKPQMVWKRTAAF